MNRATAQHVALIRRSVASWNRQRKRNQTESIDLRCADLSDADLVEANLRGAVLNRASLVGALLLGADLANASLLRADLRNADLRAARLHGADLSSSLFLTQSQLEGALGDKQTRLPAHLSAPKHW